MKKYIYIGVGIIILFWIFLLVTNSQILLKEVKVKPDEDYYLEDWGNVGDANQPSIVCTYFNGHKIIKEVFWYSPNNILGKNSCPFINRK